MSDGFGLKCFYYSESNSNYIVPLCRYNVGSDLPIRIELERLLKSCSYQYSYCPWCEQPLTVVFQWTKLFNRHIVFHSTPQLSGALWKGGLSLRKSWGSGGSSSGESSLEGTVWLHPSGATLNQTRGEEPKASDFNPWWNTCCHTSERFI